MRVEAGGQTQMLLRHQQLSSDTGSLAGLELAKETEPASQRAPRTSASVWDDK